MNHNRPVILCMQIYKKYVIIMNIISKLIDSLGISFIKLKFNSMFL